MILIDSNVVVAAFVDNHPAHIEAMALFAADPRPEIQVAAHSYAEVFVTLTRRGGPAAYAFDALGVRDSLARLRTRTILIAMTPEQTIDSIERFADIGVGARLYDYLIGRTGLLHGAEAIVTFNIKHMRGLFPDTLVLTPAEWLAR